MIRSSRRVKNTIMGCLVAAAAILAVVPLVLIFAFLVTQGASAVNLDFFMHLPKPVGEPGGGMANAILGSLILLGLAACLGLPLGILGGIYLAESRDPRLPTTVRFLADVLNGVPSIVIGIFAYTMVVLPMRRFSALAGGFALAIIMLPIVLRTTEEMVRFAQMGRPRRGDVIRHGRGQARSQHDRTARRRGRVCAGGRRPVGGRVLLGMM